MIQPFVFQSPAPRVLFGAGTVQAVPAELKLHKITKAFVLCSGSNEALARTIAATAPAGTEVLRLMSKAISSEDFERATQHAKEAGANGFIAVGGGTPIGLAKAIAANTGLPYIGITTTYSGSEMATNWNYGRGAEARTGVSNTALPATAIYDPEVTLSLPPVLSAQSGMNAIAHAVESLYGEGRSPMVEQMAEAAVRHLGHSLPRVVAKPDDMEARTEAFYGAWLAAAFRAQVGVEHAIAQKVRQRYGLSHAGTHAVVTPYAIAFNRSAAPEAMQAIKRALDVEDAAQGLYELNVRLGVPTGLKDLGMKAADIEGAADLVGASPIPNPRPISRADLVDLITQAFHGKAPRF